MLDDEDEEDDESDSEEDESEENFFCISSKTHPKQSKTHAY